MPNDIFGEDRGVASTSFDDAEAYHKAHCDDWRIILNKVETAIIKARDEKEVPVYSTKCRIKTPESIYLKTKRRGISLDSIEDFSGLRVLCLFEEDIVKVHDAILEIIATTNIELTNFKVYNFSEEWFLCDLRSSLGRHCPLKKEFKPATKLSGYKSIHYIVHGNYNRYSCPLEIQLRTLLQDVWGELEHALSYKRGMIHPHIKKSFTLLARDIETSDILMSHLKSIHNKETSKDQYGVKKSGLKRYFQYENDIYPGHLKADSVVGLCESYVENLSNLVKNKHSIGEFGFKKAQDSFDALKDEIYRLFRTEVDTNKQLNYWLKMEEALLLSMGNKYDDALDMYEKLLPDHNERYVLHFRIGEIFLIKGSIPKALRSFDRSELMLKKAMDSQGNSSVFSQNLVWIKRKLAYTYWMLGEGYINKSMELTFDVETLLKDKKLHFENYQEEFSNHCNNMCWFMTEKWQLEKRKLSGDTTRDDIAKKEQYQKTLEDANRAYEGLVAAMEQNKVQSIEIPSNLLDTAGYYCYCAYMESREQAYKELAKKYATDCDQGTNYATLSLTSLSIQINHITDIMSLG